MSEEDEVTLRMDEIYYDESSLLGEGGFGKVYKGKCRGVTVAVKVPLETPDEETMKEFSKEVKLLQKLTHPRLALFLGAAVEDGQLAIVMQLLSGDMEGILSKDLQHKRLSLFQRIVWAQQAAEGMAWLHGAGVIHRDFKPNNVLYHAPTHSVKICDFGLSVVLGKHSEFADGRTVGNPRYWAPEILLRKPWAKSVDIYAFGVSLFTFITREEVFAEWWVGGGMDPEFVDALVDRNVRPVLPDSEIECPASLRRLAARCWDADPAKRPSFLDIIDDLKKHILLDCAVFDSLARNMWRTYSGQHSEEELLLEIPWKDFFGAYSVGDYQQMPNHDSSVFEVYLYGLLCQFNPLGREVVPLAHYGRILGFFPVGDNKGRTLCAVHDRCSKPWFWGNSSKLLTTAHLKDAKVGTFIVRFANRATYRVEVKTEHGVEHIKIDHEPHATEHSVPRLIPGEVYDSLEAAIEAIGNALQVELHPPSHSPFTL